MKNLELTEWELAELIYKFWQDWGDRGRISDFWQVEWIPYPENDFENEPTWEEIFKPNDCFCHANPVPLIDYESVGRMRFPVDQDVAQWLIAAVIPKGKTMGTGTKSWQLISERQKPGKAMQIIRENQKFSLFFGIDCDDSVDNELMWHAIDLASACGISNTLFEIALKTPCQIPF